MTTKVPVLVSDSQFSATWNAARGRPRMCELRVALGFKRFMRESLARVPYRAPRVEVEAVATEADREARTLSYVTVRVWDK